MSLQVSTQSYHDLEINLHQWDQLAKQHIKDPTQRIMSQKVRTLTDFGHADWADGNCSP